MKGCSLGSKLVYYVIVLGVASRACQVTDNLLTTQFQFETASSARACEMRAMAVTVYLEHENGVKFIFILGRTGDILILDN